MTKLLKWIEQNTTGDVNLRRTIINAAYDAVEQNNRIALKLIANRCGKTMPPKFEN